MNNETIKSLLDEVKKTEQIFSDSDRGKNYGDETFIASKIVIASSDTAIVLFEKSKSKKLSMMVFDYIYSSNGGFWKSYFPKDSHILAYDKIKEWKYHIEDHNARKALVELKSEEKQS
jgi:hypothetical protein